MKVPGPSSASSESLLSEVELGQLKEEVRELFAKNRVTQERNCKGLSYRVTYHAPSLNSEEASPAGIPKWLGWVWKAWRQIKSPWEVKYPHQWFWDSCAQAIVLAHLDLDLARKEIESLLYAQRDDGFIPHKIWNPEKMDWFDRILQWLYPSGCGSPYLQPPALAEAVEQIYKESKDPSFVREVLPQLEKYYLYIERTRVRTDDGLPEIIISYESGKDRSPEYDVVYGESNAKPTWRGPMAKLTFHYWRLGWEIDKIFASERFRVKDLLFCSIYARNLSALSRLYTITGNKKKSQIFAQKARKVEEAILSKMWDEDSGLFYSLDAREGKDRKIKISTVSSFMPLILDNISEAQVERLVNDHLLDPEEFWTRYPIPANPLNSKEGKPSEHIVWRGRQTWLFTNWYIIKGLHKQALRFPGQRQKYTEIAAELTLRTYDLVSREGFREYYDAQTGEGEGAYNFGPSALILDLIYDLGTDH